MHHAKFGEGVITAIEGTGDKAEAVVHFAGIGEKRLLLAWAPLREALIRGRRRVDCRAIRSTPRHGTFAPGSGISTCPRLASSPVCVRHS